MSILEVLTGAIIVLIIQALWRALRHSRKATLNEWAGATLELLGPEQKPFDPATATKIDKVARWYRCALELDPERAWIEQWLAILSSTQTNDMPEIEGSK